MIITIYLQTLPVQDSELLSNNAIVRVLTMVLLQSVLTLLFVWRVTLLDAEVSRKPL